ncbi:MAG TPA: hypothetical protein PLC02_12445 [Pseudomonadota bacterium]|nr:hypothetical protein [Pseudomonadota bacterium]
MLPVLRASTLTPSGVTSNTHAMTTATGKPTISSSVTSRGTHSGSCNCGATVATIWISSHATTR